MRRRNHINKYAIDKLYGDESKPKEKPASSKSKKVLIDIMSSAMAMSIASGNILDTSRFSSTVSEDTNDER